MNLPTQKDPNVFVAGGLIKVARGYEVVDLSGRGYFLAAHDGPLVQIDTPNEKVLVSIPFAAEMIAALALVLIEPEAAPGAHDGEIQGKGYKLFPRP